VYRPESFEQQEPYSEFVGRWWAELGAIYNRMVPEQSPGRATIWGWDYCLAICILHDPPDDALLDFVAVGGPEPAAYK
jgi:hypothetical protein